MSVSSTARKIKLWLLVTRRDSPAKRRRLDRACPAPTVLFQKSPPKVMKTRLPRGAGVPPADRRPRRATGRRPEPSRHTFLEQDVRIVLSQEISMENAPSRRNFLAAGLADRKSVV